MKERVPNVFAVSYTIKTMLITWLEMIGFIAVMHYSVSIMNIRKVHLSNNDTHKTLIACTLTTAKITHLS